MLSALCVQQTLRFFWRLNLDSRKELSLTVPCNVVLSMLGVSLPAACSSAAFPVVSAPAVAAFPFPSCGLALSAELRLYPFSHGILIVFFVT